MSKRKDWVVMLGWILWPRTPNFEALLRLNPDRITVEDVRDILRVPLWFARVICKTCVRRGDFTLADEGVYQLAVRAAADARGEERRDA